MRFRKPRIAFSPVCISICLLLIAIWLPSYWRADKGLVPYPGWYVIILASAHGHFESGRYPNNEFVLPVWTFWQRKHSFGIGNRLGFESSLARAVLDSGALYRCIFTPFLDRTSEVALQPTNSTHRHDADSRGAALRKQF
jgi:hypothetical protein